MAGLIAVALLFLSLSFMALGGGTAIVPEMHRQAVSHYHWLTDRQFVDLYAISRVTPGPSMLIVCLVGYAAAGWPGSLVAAFCMFVPSSILTYYVRRTWDRFQGSSWRTSLQQALAPVGVGLFLAAALVIAKGADRTGGDIAVTAAATLLVAFTRTNLLLIAAVAGLIGWLGWA